MDKGSFRSVSGLAICDERGEILVSKTVIHSDILTPFATEVHAGLQAIQLAISMGFNSLQIVGDSKTMIKNANQKDPDKSTIGALIRYIQSKKVYFQHIEFHFIPKSENDYAHFPAKKALKRGVECYLQGKDSDHAYRERENQSLRQPS